VSQENKNQLFSMDEDWKNNACLHWSHDSIGLYIDGYKEAADTLVVKVAESGCGQDTLVYPIAFLYRQYIELQLKKIIRDSQYLLECEKDVPKHHKINQLWGDANYLMKEVIDKFDEGIKKHITQEDLKAISAIINDFVEVDPESFAFRYPKDKKGNNNLEGLTHINLRKLGEEINRLSEKLDKFDLVVGMLNEWKSEAQYG